VTITLDLASAPAFSLSDITSVDFQYGTDSGEGDIMVNSCTGGSDCNLDAPPVPEPASMTMLGTSLIGLCAFARRRRHQRCGSIRYPARLWYQHWSH
jgi:hypothetical protein